MVTPRRDPLAVAVDARWTVEILRAAQTVFYLNDDERDDLVSVAGERLRLRRLDNGVPVPPKVDSTSRSTPPEVLFLARLHPRKRPEVFANAALIALRRGVDAQFALVGPEEGSEAAVDSVIDQARREGFDASRLRREPAVGPDAVDDRMRRASVYVLPAVREPFGMTVVEALAVGVPVVIRGDGGLADFVTRHRCGAVVDGDASAFADAIVDLLADPHRLRTYGDDGRMAVRQTYGMHAVARELGDAYRCAAEREGEVSR
jgi:glycosyltransferase involved in cell wall biosynthesis